MKLTSLNNLLAGQGEIQAFLRGRDWDSSVLGAIETWPPSLRTALGMILGSTLPMQIFWGEEAILFYNDACISWLADQHPQALGKPVSESGLEFWQFMAAEVERVRATGEGRGGTKYCCWRDRQGPLHKTHLSFSVAPIWDEQGEVGGVFVTLSPSSIPGDRQQQLLQAEVRQAKENLERVLASINDAFMMFDHNWRYTYLNTPALQMLGKSKAELLNRCIWEVFPEAVGNLFYQEMHRAFTEQTPICFEHYYHPWQRWYENRVYPFSNGMSLFVVDITDRKHSEAALRQSEERLKIALDSSPIAVFNQDRDLRYTWIYNPAFQQMGETFLGKQDADFFTPEEAEGLTQIKQRVLHTGIGAREEVKLRVNGQDYYYDLTVEPLFDEANQVTGITCAAVDISDRKHTEQALRDAIQKLNFHFENTPIAVIERDRHFQVMRWSHSAEKIFGWSAEEVLGQDWQQVYEEDLPIVQAVRQGLISGQEKHNVSFNRSYTKEGKIVYCEWYNSALLDEAGNIVSILSLVLDVTERQQTANERDRLLEREKMAREEAEAANRIKDEFLAVLSHELRTPLNPILGWTQLLRSRKYDDATTQRALETIERNAKLQTQLIDDLLDVSRILRGKLRLTITTVNLQTILEAAIDTVRLAADAKSLHIETRIESQGRLVLGDSGRLQQVVWNLLSNAVKFTPGGGRVVVELRSLSTQAQIRISDTGEGISLDFLPYIFEYFRQADGSTTRTFGGLGLGLAIARHLVELHGGTIQATSLGRGTGSTFTVQLPLLPEQQRGQPPVDGFKGTVDLSGLRILLVDDEADVREVLTFALEQYGAITMSAASGREAIALFDRVQPDILISDIGMPEMDGYTLIQLIRSFRPDQGGNIPAIALTAYATESDRQQALTAGFQQHMAKPLTAEELARVVATLRLNSPENTEAVGN